MRAETEKAYMAWRRAADRGYGERDHSRAHMERVDARIRRLKAEYESLLDAERSADEAIDNDRRGLWPGSIGG